MAREIMQSRVDTVPIDMSVLDAVRLLLQRGHSGAPVVDAEGRLRGVLSEHDCVRVLAEAVAEGWPEGRVGDRMSSEVECVPPSEDVLSLASRFSRGRHRRLVVVEDEQPIGLITRRDLLAALVDLEQTLGAGRVQTTYELIEERRRKLD
jgi:CBS domain-containing protein